MHYGASMTDPARSSAADTSRLTADGERGAAADTPIL